MLQPRQVSYYTAELNNITDDLITHIRRVRDASGDEAAAAGESGEQQLANTLPNHMYRWSMECEYRMSGDRLNVLMSSILYI